MKILGLLHFHRDPNWQQRDLYAYYECRCGARRTRRVILNHYGPVKPGWPEPRDKHGRTVIDSGWKLDGDGSEVDLYARAEATLAAARAGDDVP